MASQSVLLPPNESLFITDKSWLRPEKSSKPGQSIFSINRSSATDGLSVTVVKTGFKCRKGSKDPPKVDEIPKNRGLQFVNTTQTKRGKQDAAEVRRIVRSHVMTGTRRQAPIKSVKTLEDYSKNISSPPALNAENEESFDEEITSQHSNPSWSSSTSSSTLLSLLPSGTSTPLYGRTSFKIHPHFHRLMTYYSTEIAFTMYPLQRYLGFNPVQRHWFPTALTDEVLLHTIMYSAALGLSRSRSPSTALSATHDLTQLAAPILRLLTSRLSSSSTITDPTIAAVSCLVMVETERGNPEKSLLHLKGLSQMISARGGLENISPDLIMKIIRADIEGSVDNLTPPVLPPVKRLAPSLYDTLPPHARTLPPETFMAVLSLPALVEETHLVGTMLQLAEFTAALNYYTAPSPSGSHPTSRIHPRAYDEDLLSLSAAFLALQPQSHTSTSTTSLLTTPLLLASLLFTKSLSRPLPFSPTGSQLLPQRLHQSLLPLLPPITSPSTPAHLPLPLPLPLHLFLLTLGAVSSQPTAPSSLYFTSQLLTLIESNPTLKSWEKIRSLLKELLFVDMVHEMPYRKLWEQVVRMYDLKQRWDRQVERGW